MDLECLFSNKKLHIDCFAVMEFGGKFAKRKFKYECEKKEIQLEYVTFYDYYPPIHQHYTGTYILRENEKEYFKKNFLGRTSENINKKGSALILDDAIETGLALNFSRKFLLKNGYNDSEILVFANQRGDCPRSYGDYYEPKLEPISFYIDFLKTSDEKFLEMSNQINLSAKR